MQWIENDGMDTMMAWMADTCAQVPEGWTAWNET